MRYAAIAIIVVFMGSAVDAAELKIRTESITISGKSVKDVQSIPAYKIGVVDSKTQELTFPSKASPKELSYRLIHDGKKVLALYYCSGITSTIHELVVVEKADEVRAKAKELGLVGLDAFEEEFDHEK